MPGPPRHLACRRLSELLKARLHEPWSVGRLAWTVGLSSRTLHRVVQHELGVSPMALLRQVRLAQARAELAAAMPRATVTTVALDCGFNHLGRFSADYAKHFGERPSETLRRARQGRRLRAVATALEAPAA